MINELEKSIQGRDAVNLFEELENKMARLPPNGATNHKRDNIRQGLMGNAYALREIIRHGRNPKYFLGMTMQDYKIADPSLYRAAITILEASKNFLGITL